MVVVFKKTPRNRPKSGISPSTDVKSGSNGEGCFCLKSPARLNPSRKAKQTPGKT